jgi:CRISPR-associated protein Csb2
VFAFEVEYLLGRSFAGDFRDRSASEWPPNPGRLYSALAAAYFENGKDAGEKAALEWLERQQPPHIRAGTPGDAAMTQAFVPTNYPGEGPPAIRGKQPRVFPAQGPSEAMVYFVWPTAEPSSDAAAALDELAARTAYLGKACSVVRMRATAEVPEPNYMPDGAGEAVLRIPARGRLAELGRMFEAGQQVTGGAQQRYRRTDGQTAGGAVFSEFGQMIVFRKTSGPGLPVDATLTLTEAVRKALMSNAGNGGAMAESIHGHNGDTHCAIAALPFVDREHADGHVLGFAVVVPRAATPEERRAVLAACEELVERGLHIAGLGEWALEPADAAAIQFNLRAQTWVRPSRVWRSVTPILLDRFPKKKGPSVEEIVAASCRRIGLPAPAAVVHAPYSQMAGVPPVPAFRLRRTDEERPRWGIHARIEFAKPVRGPVLLGAGRYFGLGLMRPEPEAPNGRG